MFSLSWLKKFAKKLELSFIKLLLKSIKFIYKKKEAVSPWILSTNRKFSPDHSYEPISISQGVYDENCRPYTKEDLDQETQKLNITIDNLRKEVNDLKCKLNTKKHQTLTSIRQSVRNRDLDKLSNEMGLRFCELTGRGGYLIVYTPNELMSQELVASVNSAIRDQLPDYQQVLLLDKDIRIEELTEIELNNLGLARIVTSDKRKNKNKRISHDPADDK